MDDMSRAHCAVEAAKAAAASCVEHVRESVRRIRAAKLGIATGGPRR